MAYTQLQPTGLPGKPYTYVGESSKGPHTGRFTVLSVMGLPGRRYSFPEEEAEAEAVRGGAAGRERRLKLVREKAVDEENDIMTIMVIIQESGILN